MINLIEREGTKEKDNKDIYSTWLEGIKNIPEFEPVIVKIELGHKAFKEFISKIESSKVDLCTINSLAGVRLVENKNEENSIKIYYSNGKVEETTMLPSNNDKDLYRLLKEDRCSFSLSSKPVAILKV